MGEHIQPPCTNNNNLNNHPNLNNNHNETKNLYPYSNINYCPGIRRPSSVSGDKKVNYVLPSLPCGDNQIISLNYQQQLNTISDDGKVKEQNNNNNQKKKVRFDETTNLESDKDLQNHVHWNENDILVSSNTAPITPFNIFSHALNHTKHGSHAIAYLDATRST